MAPRTCAQCKASKKKCDKLVPVCSRCSRLSIRCLYEADKPEIPEDGRDSENTKIDEVLRRLDRIENLFSTTNTAVQDQIAHTPSFPIQEVIEHSNQHDNQRAQHKWAIDPGHLKPEYAGFMMFGSVFRVMSASLTSVENISKSYFEFTHKWLPIISPERFEQGFDKFKDFRPDNSFLLTLLAMHLIVTPPSQHPPATSLDESPWYRACKYYFGIFTAFAEPYIPQPNIPPPEMALGVEVIQAGMLIALFEYTQCISNRALVTLGFCARLAYMLELDEIVAQQNNRDTGSMTLEQEESIQTWWGLILLDRYFNMPPVQMPKHQAIQQKPFQMSFLDDHIAGGPSANSITGMERNALELYLLELEASRMLAQVQVIIREDRRNEFLLFPPIGKDLDAFVKRVRKRQEQTDTWAGVPLSISAALQLRLWVAQKRGTLDYDTMVIMHGYIEDLRKLIAQCTIMNMFTKNYLEQLNPTWISIAYLAISAYKFISSVAADRLPSEIPMDIFYKLLETMVPRYKFAEHCIGLLRAT